MKEGDLWHKVTRFYVFHSSCCPSVSPDSRKCFNTIEEAMIEISKSVYYEKRIEEVSVWEIMEVKGK